MTLIVAEERERCAKIVEMYADTAPDSRCAQWMRNVASCIRKGDRDDGMAMRWFGYEEKDGDK